MNDEQYLLASAYLDGELTAAERAAAETDPAVMRAVEELRALQAGVAESPAPAPAARAAGLSAAMHEYDRVHGAASATARPVAAQLHRPGVDWGRYLSIAAAVLVVGVLGVVIASAIGGRGGDDDLATESAPDPDASQELDAAAAGQSATEAASATVPRVAADAGIAAESTAAGEGDMEIAAPAGTEAAVSMSAGDETAALSSPVEPVSDPDAVVTTPNQLTGLGILLLEQARSGSLGPTPETACTFAQAVGTAPTSPETAAVDPANVHVLAEGRYDFGGTVDDVLVFVEQTTGQGFAVDPGACTVLVAGVVP